MTLFLSEVYFGMLNFYVNFIVFTDRFDILNECVGCNDAVINDLIHLLICLLKTNYGCILHIHIIIRYMII